MPKTTDKTKARTPAPPLSAARRDQPASALRYSIKALHAKTGAILREAARSRRPIVITDNGQDLAVIASTTALPPPRPRKRILLPEFAQMMNELPVVDFVVSALREERSR